MSIEQNTSFDEQGFVVSLKGEGRDQDEYIRRFINHNRGLIQKMHQKTQVKTEILKDLFTDAVMLVLDHVENGTFRGESKLSTYFYQIFYFQTVDYVRRQAANKIDYTDNLPDYVDDRQDISQQLEAYDEMDQVIRLLDRMSDICRKIILEWGYWGYKAEEIRARILEMDRFRYTRIKYNCLIEFTNRWEKEMGLYQN